MTAPALALPAAPAVTIRSLRAAARRAAEDARHAQAAADRCTFPATRAAMADVGDMHLAEAARLAARADAVARAAVRIIEGAAR